jgi:VCBS repeat protein
MRTGLAVLRAARVTTSCLLMPFLLILVALSQPQRSVAGVAWDVIRYHSATGGVASDTFAFEKGDPYQGYANGYLFAGACQPTCYPMWSNSLNSGSPGAGWAVVGAADFDSNGTTDLVYQNVSTGQVSVSFFKGSYAQTFMSSVSLPSLPPGFNVEAVGDLNGDGVPDILLFNPSTGARQVNFYAFAQGTLTQSGSAPILSSIPTVQHVVAIADINQDGQSDLITQNLNNGDVKVAYLSYTPGSGFSITGFQFMNSTGSLSSVVIGAADADGDGYPDLFYMNTSSGEITVNYFVYNVATGPELNPAYGNNSWSEVEWVNSNRRVFIAPRIKQAPAPRVLVYIGSTTYTGCENGGVSDHDFYAIEREMDAMGLGFDTATYDGDGNTLSLNAMPERQFKAYGLLIVPGGNFGCIVVNWTEATREAIQTAVLRGPLSYLGICAGAFVAGSTDPNLNLTGLPISKNGWDSFDFYSLYYGSMPRTDIARLQLSLAPGSQFGSDFDTYWFDGPQLTGFGDVIAAYPDGTPAVAEVSNNGFVVLSGVHSEAPGSWIGSSVNLAGYPFQTNFAFAASLINAAVTKTCVVSGPNCP